MWNYVTFLGNKFWKKLSQSINYRKVGDYCHYTGATHGIVI